MSLVTAVITALLIATAPGEPPETLAAFFDGDTLCLSIAEALNHSAVQHDSPVIYVCEVH